MQNLKGTDYVLEIDTETPTTALRGTDANFRLVACLTSNGLEISTASTEITNKCSDGNAESMPGLTSSTFSGEGQAVSITELEEDTMINFEEIAALANDKEVFFIRMTNVAKSTYREAKVWMSSYGETAGNEELYTFTATFQVTGKLYLAPPTP